MWRAMLPKAIRVLPLSIAVLVFFGCLPGSIAARELEPIRRVLILYEAGTSYPGINLIDQGIRATLDTSPHRLEVYREYMDAVLFPDPGDQQRFREFYVRKYQNRRPKVIITVGPTPLKFMVEMRDRGFPGVSIVFCLPWLPTTPALASGFTGVENEWGAFETIQAALRLQPGTRHIVVVGGTSSFDTQAIAVVKEQLRPYEGNFDVSYLTTLTMPDLLEQLEHLPNHTIVLFSTFDQDAAGKKFISGTEAAPAVAAAANAPVFSMFDSHLNHGEVGGKVMSLHEIGGIAADMALRILNGDRPQDVPSVKAPNMYMFDWRALKRWGLKERNLPPGSILLNRQATFWESYKRYVFSGISLMGLEALLIFALLWQRARRRRAESELVIAYDRLRIAVEAGRFVGWDWDVKTGTNRWFGDLNGLFGIPAENYFAESDEFQSRVHPADRDLVWKAIEKARQNREPYTAEFRIPRDDGSVRWVIARGKFYYTTNGDAERMLGLAFDITARKQAEEALSSVSRRLIEAHEEERTWIARELHDDINQRIALLAVNLERLKQDLPASNGHMGRRVREVQEHVASLGTDIQALSHRLHSSKLEYLGLAAACEGFCREFSGQQNVEIDFRSQNIPKELPQEIGLCLFRVLQEALQNAARHSGVRRFEVFLKAASNEIELAVRDSGAGFDLQKAMSGSGLGFASMKERMKLIDGHLSIDLKPQGGTTIYARAPLTRV